MDLKTVDLTTLTTQEQMQLYPFFDAYNRKYPPAMTWRDCVNEGLTRREWTTVGLDEIQESLDELDMLSTFHVDESGMVVPGVGDRATWLDRKINAWTRR